jgi:tetratricopeptide (TPR) repeat protein
VTDQLCYKCHGEHPKMRSPCGNARKLALPRTHVRSHNRPPNPPSRHACLVMPNARNDFQSFTAGTVVLAISLATHNSALAYGGLDNYALTRIEVATLPDFCRHTQLIIKDHGSPDEQRMWVQRTGPGFMHMHHYCIAAIAIFRSLRATNTASDRNGYLQFAIGNLEYVVRNAAPGYVFMPEVYYRLGSAKRRMGQSEEAAQALEKALEGFPKYTLASIELAQIHMGRGNPGAAEKVLSDALEKTPDSELVKSALQELSKKRQTTR